MPNTDILTFDQGIILMIETSFFLLYYLRINSCGNVFGNILIL